MKSKIDKIIEHTRATMAFEGLETDKEVENLYIKYHNGEITYDEMMDEINKGVQKIIKNQLMFIGAQQEHKKR